MRVGSGANLADMESRAQTLRRRISAYRSYLAVSADIHIFRRLLNDIAIDEAELARLERSGELLARVSERPTPTHEASVPGDGQAAALEDRGG